MSEENPLGVLVGGELDTVSFVRDYVELRIDYSIVRALTNLSGTIDGIAWRFSDKGAADVMRRYIGRTVADVEVTPDQRILLTFDRDARLEIPLRPEDMRGPEAAHVVPARADGTLDIAAMWI
jgi:hypothetical protein